VYLFRNEELLGVEDPAAGEAGLRLPTEEEARALEGLAGRPAVFRDPGGGRFAVGRLTPEAPDIPGTRRIGLRSVPGLWGEEAFVRIGRAHSLARWLEETRFCGGCGTPTEPHPTDRARLCPRCGQTSYPPVIPAIMAAVEREGRLLLARSPHFPRGRFSILAGFVEPGEDLEEAVRREVREEVGLEATDLRYVASQPWPFPHSLMIGFLARSEEGEIAIDGVEIEEAFWWDPEEPRDLPPYFSLSRKIIDRWLRRRRR